MTHIGLQLYTVREALNTDLSGTLDKIVDAGYTAVETAFFAVDVTPEAAGSALRAAGLTVLAAHTELPLGDTADGVLRLAEGVGTQRVVWHGWPRDPRYDSLDGILHLCAEINAANEIAVANGLTLAIHNHWWECEPVDGQLPYQICLAELDPRVVFELDAYWVRVAGQDPAAVVKDLGERLAILHLKDGQLTKDAVCVPLGTGQLDIPAVLAATGKTPEWLVVELDHVAGDVFAAITESRRYLSELMVGE